MEQRNWVQEIEKLFSEKLLTHVESADTDLFETGILDSMSLLELLLQLEQTMGVTVSIAELDMDDLRTIRKIAHLVECLASQSQITAAGV